MRRSRVLIATTLALVAVIAVAWWALHRPRVRLAGQVTYDCSVDEAARPPLLIDFQQRGALAVVRYGERTARHSRMQSDLLTDRYSNGAVTLTIDPEAFVTGLTPEPIGPCQ